MVAVGVIVDVAVTLGRGVTAGEVSSGTMVPVGAPGGG
jgi:hypothetical protein